MKATETLWQDVKDFMQAPDATLEWLASIRHHVGGEVEAIACGTYDDYLKTNDSYIWRLAGWHLLDDKPNFDFAFPPPLSGAALLDFGCGIGTRGIAHVLHGWRVDFVEINEPMRRFVRFRLNRLKLAGGIYNKIPKDKQYDMVLCVDVLGHLEHPHRDAVAMCQALKKGGKLFVTWDNINNAGDAVHINNDFDFKALFVKEGLVAENEVIWRKN